MRAFVYTERWSRTSDSEKPKTYYVVSYYHPENSTHQIGCQEIRSSDKKHIIDEIMKMSRQPTIKILGRLPNKMRTVETLVLENHPEKLSVEIIRKGFDLSFLRGK